MVHSPPRTNPFPGLRPFELDEEHLFFGREGQADELLKRLNRTRFLGVVGTSGSGKSSLVRAGLLPSLYSGFLASSGWRVAILRPGSAPIGNLAAALNHPEVLGIEASGDDAMIRAALMESTLRRGALGLVEVARQAPLQPHENLLVVVDQFEELFRFKQQARQESSTAAENEAAAFVKLLLAAVNQRQVPIYVVLTMRSDFLGDCAQFRDLPEALNDSQYLIPRLTRDQLTRAIEGPVAVGGATITPRLVNRLLNDTGDNPDQLPILQHALMRTWDYWEERHAPGEPIDFEHYEYTGGMARALSLHADQVYFSFAEQKMRKLAETIFKRLTERGFDNREVRRPTTLKELCLVAKAQEEEVVQVINQFRKDGISFLTPPSIVDIQEDSIIDISQESLMRIWDRLQKWMSEEVEDARTYKRLAETAQLYQEGKAALIRDPDLMMAQHWQRRYGENSNWAQRYGGDFQQSINFIKRSEERKSSEEDSRKTKTSSYLYQNWLSIASIILLIVTILFLFNKNLPEVTSQTARNAFLFFIVLIAGYSIVSIRIINQGNEALVERLGRYNRKLKPGLNFIVPFVDSIVLLESIREQILDLEPHIAHTRDNVPVEFSVLMYWRILELERAYYEIEDLERGILEIAATTLTEEIGELESKFVLNSRDELNRTLIDVLDEATEPWGVKIMRVEIQQMTLLWEASQT